MDSDFQPFWSDYWDSFVKVQGVVLTIGALLITLLLELWGPKYTLVWDKPLVLIFSYLLLLTFTFILTLVDLLIKARRARRPRLLPKILSVIHPNNPEENSQIILMLEPSPLLGMEGLISVYYKDQEGYEKLVSWGRVLTIQEDKKIQVAILGFTSEADKKHLLTGQKAYVSSLLVRPTVPFDILTKQDNGEVK